MRSVRKRIEDYIFNASVSLQDRSFVLFSCLVLIALYAAVPLGLIMREPLSATLSTFVGAIVFSAYVYYVFTKNKISRAKIVLSIVVVFLFLPSMFFTNGGALSGVPLWLLLGTVYIGLILDGRMRTILLTLNMLVLILCWIVGYRHPELVTEFSRGQGYFDSIASLFIISGIIYTLFLFCVSLFRKDEKQKNLHHMTEQMVTALVNAIDANDEYTYGHSERVAKYSKKIAELYGKSPTECDEIYQIAYLHDIGKIGISENIINKTGKLTNEEFEVIKKHPVLGAQIMESVDEYPNLLIGARYHHERYDGKGYPDQLKGKEIPEVARIISVADAYDAMTSKRSYRDPLPQHIVREEFVKGIGTQFDPDFAKIMIHMIDLDTEYRMKESASGANMTSTASLRCDSLYHDCTEGVNVTRKLTKIRMCSQPDDGFSEEESLPTLIVFDSLDGRVHPGEENNKDILYFEYARIRLDGQVTEGNTRKAELRVSDRESDLEPSKFGEPERGQRYKVEAVRNCDHALVRVSDEKRMFDVILALPDTSRFVYIAIGGEHCEIHNIRVDTAAEETDPEAIPRVAEKISFIKDCPEGDVPNLQVDGWRTDATDGIPIRDGMTLSFHSMSLPTARLVWHCPFISVFSSGDGRIDGANFREYILLRLDGENWESDDHAENSAQVEQRESFGGWDVWKDENKKGLDCVVKIKREKNVILMETENLGIAIRSVTTIRDNVKDVYVALTGDQCAITNIHASREMHTR